MPNRQLTALQALVLRQLWEHGEATVTELCEALNKKRRIAPTTLATILTRLERRGVVAHRSRSRQFVYRATVTELEVRRAMVSELIATLFEGDAPALARHLLTAQGVSSADIVQIRSLLA